ncbi:ATP-binding protein [Streptomyces sp. NPDC004546]|uniref:ATP-binding protein n=1 Tax=Streptomyces sp. NPDC004546 TaxID=3154282 RepID=UPI0033BE420A
MYSTCYPDKAWTADRLCQRRMRRRADGSTIAAQSVLADLGAAFRRLLDEHGAEACAKTRIALVSNQPADPTLLSSITAASRWVRAQAGTVQKRALLAALEPEAAAVIRSLSDTLDGQLTSSQFGDFLTVLDLSQSGAMDRATLARAVRAGVAELTARRGHDSALRLFHLVRKQAMPGASRAGIIRDDVLAELAVPELLDLYPAPARFDDVPDPLPTPGARAIADAVLSHSGRLLIAHGDAGAGKTTAVRQIGDHLPSGSVVIQFDCYGGGDYLSAGEERHTPQRFVTQVVNEIAQRCGTPLLVPASQSQEDLWRRLRRTMEMAIVTLPADAVLVLAVDAADNAAVAARQRGDRGFLPDLVRLPLPDRVTVVLTARSHRVDSLGAAAAAPRIGLAGFDPATSSAHLRRHWADASDADTRTFHDRTDGNPRAQFYALEQAEAQAWDMPTLLDKCAKTPTAVFEDLIQSALQVGGADAGGLQWLAVLLALSRPVSIGALATALDVDRAAVTSFAAGLAPGVRVVDGAIQFRDEDFETYVRGRVDPLEVVAAHHRLADLFLAARTADPDAAAYVADHLFAARRLDEVLHLVLDEDSPEGIADGFRCQQVQGRRLDLAARAASETGDAAAAVRLAARGCDTASRFDTLSRLVESQLDLAARYADLDLLRSHALRQKSSTWLGPNYMKMAAALARDPERHAAARADLDSAGAWLRRWMAQREGEGEHWNIEPDDIAAAAEARYRLDGIDAAVGELRRWRPTAVVLEAAVALAARLAGDLVPADVQEILRVNQVPPTAQVPIIAALASPTAPPNPPWVDEMVTTLASAPVGEPQPWQAWILDNAVRHGDRQLAAGLARHWSRPLPTRQWQYSGHATDGTVILRCLAAAAALEGSDLHVPNLVPEELQPRISETGRTEDPQAHEREQWIRRVEPLAAAAVLAIRAAAGEVDADDVTAFCDQGLDDRISRTATRWFTYDRSYAPWTMLIASAAIDTETTPALFDRLADAAEALLRDGAPELWLELAGMLAPYAHHAGRVADLCLRAAAYVREHTYSAPDRLDLLARCAALAAKLDAELGRDLFDQAVEAATGINDDAAGLLSVHADLARRTNLIQIDRCRTAARLVRAAETVAPHVTEAGIVPWADVAEAAARLDPMAGFAAASRWDDEDRIGMESTLPAALAGAVDSQLLPVSQVLALDHLIADDGGRLQFQLHVAERLASGGAADRTEARRVLARAAGWLRRHVPARRQPAAGQRILDAAEALGLGDSVRTTLEPVIRLGRASDHSDDGALVTSRDWSRRNSPPPDVQALLANPAARGWTSLTDDVKALDDAFVYGERLRAFVTAAVQNAPYGQRAEALAAVAALPDWHTDDVLAVLADCLRRWHAVPRVAAWAKEALPDVLARLLPRLSWVQDVGSVFGQLRSFTDEAGIRRAVLEALPEVRPQLAAGHWKNIATLLGQLCGDEDAGRALSGLLDDRVPDDGFHGPGADSTAAVTGLLWSAFGHPRREMRWRAAHATRELLAGPGSAAVGPLAAELVRCLDDSDTAAFRAPELHFYRLSACAGLLVALERVATERPAVLAAHFADLARHATSRELPHAQIRELARHAALAVAESAGAPDITVEALRLANQPTRWHANRQRRHEGNDRYLSVDRRYDFDPMDTIPYWYAPLARVFDVPVDTIAETAEAWILDRWGMSSDDWRTDVRALRDERSWHRTSHRQGAIPLEESLQLYIEYHAMMTAAGELSDNGRPACVGTWTDDDEDAWSYWLQDHLPNASGWLADLGNPVPAEPHLFGLAPTLDDTWSTPETSDFDDALGLADGQPSGLVRVAARTSLSRHGARENIYVWSALVTPDHAEDLQRALAAAPNPMDWRLPDEHEDEFEVDHGSFQLRGWLFDPFDPGETLDRHDAYAHELRRILPLPGDCFRSTVRATRDHTGLVLLANDGTLLARAEQWADPDPGTEREPSIVSSGHRVHVDRAALLQLLSATGSNLITEVQIGRHRTGIGTGGYRIPRSRIYLLNASGELTAR